MKLLPIFFLTFLPIPAQAITWDQFWAPFAYDRPYIYERRYTPLCNRRVYYEDYVPGNYWRSGYVRRWSEIVRVPCDEY
jgi:hypothetical protein